MHTGPDLSGIPLTIKISLKQVAKRSKTNIDFHHILISVIHHHRKLNKRHTFDIKRIHEN